MKMNMKTKRKILIECICIMRFSLFSLLLYSLAICRCYCRWKKNGSINRFLVQMACIGNGWMVLTYFTKLIFLSHSLWFASLPSALAVNSNQNKSRLRGNKSKLVWTRVWYTGSSAIAIPCGWKCAQTTLLTYTFARFSISQPFAQCLLQMVGVLSEFKAQVISEIR